MKKEQPAVVKGVIYSETPTIKGVVNVAKGGQMPGSGGTFDYNQMQNKPQIDGVELAGNRSLEEIGVKEISGQDLLDIFDEIWR